MRRIGFAAMSLLCLSLLLAATNGVSAEAPAVELTAEPSHHLALENERVRVFQVAVAPHTSTLLHRHGHDYLFVTLGDARFMNEVPGKAPVEVKLADGETRFSPGDFAHTAKNLADRPFRNVTIELLQDGKLRQAPSPWPPESEGNREFPQEPRSHLPTGRRETAEMFPMLPSIQRRRDTAHASTSSPPTPAPCL